MSDIHGGRVLAGEDSEEDDEDDEAYSFQFGGFGAQSGAPNIAPRFAGPSVGVSPQTGGEESDEEDSEKEAKAEEAAAPDTSNVASESEEGEERETGVAAAVDEPSSDIASADGEAAASVGASGSSGDGATPKDLAAAASTAIEKKPVASDAPCEDSDEVWGVDASMDGPKMMGDAFVRNVQPALDATIQRIEELRSNQTRLLQLLADQNASVASNKQIEDAAVVLDKLPHYFAKVQMIRAAMAEISASTDKMKRRSESLRIDAQSHALKKENKRDTQSQWNKLYAAKSAAPPRAAGES